MKCQIVTDSPKTEFEKFKLEITVETEDDLSSLWHMFNLPEHQIYDDNFKWWNLLDEEVRKRGMKEQVLSQHEQWKVKYLIRET